MSSSKKIFSEYGERLLSARAAALRLHCAPDYVGKLCREGKLAGRRIDNAWFVEESSIAAFEAERRLGARARAEKLAQERAQEALAYRYQNGGVVARARIRARGLLPHRTLLAAACASILLGAAIAAAGAAMHGKDLSAALAQIDSPFFGARMQSVSLDWTGSSVSGLFDRLYALIAPAPIGVAQAPAPAEQGGSLAREGVALDSKAPTTLVQNTYPVTERVIERVVVERLPAGRQGVSEDSLASKLQELGNTLRSELYAGINNIQTPRGFPSSGGVANNVTIIQKIDKLDNVLLTGATVHGLSGLSDSDVPDELTASNYLALAGGALTGAVTNSATATSTWSGPFAADVLNVSTTTATSTFANGIALTGGCFLLPNGTCAGSGGASVSGGTAGMLTAWTDATTLTATSGPTAGWFTATSTTSSIFPYASSTALTVSGTASTTNLNISAISSCSGGSALTTDVAGVVVCGAITASGGVFPFTPTANGNATSTTLIFGSGFISQASSTLTGNATTTGMHGVGSLFINSERFTDLTDGTILSNVGGVLTATITGGNGITVTANDIACDTANASTFGCLAAADWALFNDKISSTSLSATFPLSYNSSTGAFAFSGLSTSTAAVVGNIPYFSGPNTFANAATGTVSAGSGIGVTGGQSVIGSGLTITNTIGYPFTAGTNFATTTSATTTSLHAAGVFFASSTVAASQFPYASSTALTVSGTGYFGTASTTNLTVSGSPSGILQTNSSGVVSALTTSAAIISNLSDETGTGFAVFSASPSITTPTISSPTISGLGSHALLTLGAGGVLTATSTPSASYFIATSSTASILPFASTTALSVASGNAGLSLTGLNSSLLKTNASGQVVAATAGTDYSNFAWPFIPGSNFATTTSATTTSLHAAGVFFASSTVAASQFPYASSTALTVSGTGYFGTASTTALRLSGTQTFENLTSGGLAVNASGQVYKAATTTFSTGLTYANGAVTCDTANASTFGCLAAADWSLFNDKVSSSSIDSSAELAALITDETGSGALVFGTQPTISDGRLSSTTLSTNTLLSNATTTYFGVTGLATSTFAQGINLSTGCFAVNNACVSGGSGGTIDSGTAGQLAYYAANGTALSATSSLFLATSGNFGIGSSTPSARLAVGGGIILQNAFGSSTAAATVATNGHTYNTAISGRYAYVADYEGGLRIFDITHPAKPSIVGAYTGTASALSVAVQGRYAYVGDTTGISVLDVSNPTSPTLLGRYGGITFVYTLAVSGKYLYAVDFNAAAMRIIDISNPAAPALAGSFLPGGSSSPYAVAAQGKYAYLGDQGNAAIYIVDVSNPAAPARTAVYSLAGSAPGALYISGKYLYVADSAKGVYVLNVGNPTATPALAASFDTAGSYYGVAAAGRYVYASDHGGNFVVLDYAASTTLALVGRYNSGGAPWGVAVSGKYAYLGGDTQGLRVIDLNGADLPAAHIGALESNTVNVTDELAVGGDIRAGGGLSAGIAGIFSRGAISATVASTTQTNPTAASFMGGNVGISTSSPYARLSILANHAEYINQNLFAVASSTGTGTSTLFTINNMGSTTLFQIPSSILTTNSSGTIIGSSTLSTVYGGTGLNAAPTYGQILLGNTSNGYTLSATSTLFANSAQFAQWLSDETGTGFAVFSASPSITTPTISSPTISGLGSHALLTLGAGGVLTATSTPSASYFIATSSTASILPFASSTSLTVSGTASTTALVVSGLNSANCDVKANTSGTFSCGSDQGAFPFTQTTFGATNANSTSTLIGFTQGLYALASSTIGDGTQAGGLTISGGATTTGRLLVQGSGTSTVDNGLSAGTFSAGITTLGTTTLNSIITSTATSTALNYIASGLGAAGAPAFTFTGDLNTGIWSSSADTLNFSTGGSERLRIDSSGDVGIGGTSAGGLLDVGSGQFVVEGNVGVATLASKSSTMCYGVDTLGGRSVAVLGFCTSDARLKHDITYLDGGGLAAINQLQPAHFVFNGASSTSSGFIAQDVMGVIPTAVHSVAGSEYFAFDSTAVLAYSVKAIQELNLKVEGIASSTATTTALNYIASGLGAAGAPAFTFTGDLNTGIWSSSADTLNFSTGGSERLRIDSSGNVGIGSTTPNATLVVSGDAYLDGASRYLNFGTAAQGANGYGFRDNAGKIEVKNSGGSWKPVMATSTQYARASGPLTSTLTNEWTLMNLDTASLDPSSLVNTTTEKITPTEAGFYIVTVAVKSGGGTIADQNRIGAGIYVNDAPIVQNVEHMSGANDEETTAATAVVYLDGDDYVQAYGLQNSGTTNNLLLRNFSVGKIGGSDYAEYVLPEAGTVVADYGAGELLCVKSTAPDTYGKCAGRGDPLVAGVVSTHPGVIGNSPASLQERDPFLETFMLPMAMLGRVPVKVNLEGGDIAIGDRLAASSQPGFAMRATTTAQTIGVALGAFTATSTSSTVDVYIQPQFTQGPDDREAIAQLLAFAGQLSGSSASSTASSSPAVSPEEQDTFIGRLLKNIFTRVAAWLADAGNEIAAIFAAEVHAETVYAKKLCLEDVCITKAELQKLLDIDMSNGQTTSTASTASTSSTSPQPSSETTAGTAEQADDGQSSDTGAPVASDVEPPVITINGNNPALLQAGDSYSDLGAAVSDNVDRNLGIKALIDGGEPVEVGEIRIDTSVPGEHTITYRATDQAGNTGEATRTVTVEVEQTTNTTNTTETASEVGEEPASSPGAMEEQSTPEPKLTPEQADESSAQETPNI